MIKPLKFSLFFWFVLAAVSLRAVPVTAPIAEDEALQLPTAKRLAAIMAAAQHEGWAQQSPPLREAARVAYTHDKLAVAEAWFNVYRWTEIFGLNDAAYIPRWLAALQTEKVAHANMPPVVSARRLPLGLALLPDFQLWLLGNTAFSEEFFATITPVDYLPAVLKILEELHFRDPAKFKTYASLALAIAVVYDVPPPPYWPHSQVAADALPRKLPRPLDAFIWWTKQDELGRTYQRLNRLGAEELKFVVDAAAPFTELEWSQQVANYPLNSLARAYNMVRYDNGRAQRNDLNWSGRPYTMDGILAEGGICVDQGYFAAQVGKARGVPTLLFRGEGTDSRHAWFGFLDASQKWQLDAGRYAEQRFITGYALDPQTWRDISDHDLKFLSERFRLLPSYQQSRIHTEFATGYLATGNAAEAEVAARKAINYERRNQPAWETLILAEQALGRDPKQRETTLRAAAQAFQAYPDLEAAYSTRVGESMRARGDSSAADFEQSRISQKNQGNRGDLSLQEARRTLTRSFNQPLPEQVHTYNTLVASQGRGAGMAFFDQIVLVFAEHLVQLQQPAEAMHAVETARQSLKVDPNSQLAREIERLTQRVKTPP